MVRACTGVLCALLLAGCDVVYDPSPEPGLQQPLGGGEALAFSRMDVNPLNAGDLYLVDDVNGVRPITRSKEYDGRPVWSPDGMQIVYTSARDGKFQYYLIDVDGTNRRQVALDDDFKDLFQWSPDGSRLAYLAYEWSGDSVSRSPRLCIVEIVTGETRRMSVGDVEDFVWMPDGRSLLMIVHADDLVSVELYGVDGSHERRVAEANHLHEAVYIAISPDASKVAYALSPEIDENGECLTNPLNSECFTSPVYVSSLDGSAVEHVGNLDEGAVVVWSPDSTKVAFVTLDSDFNGVLYVVNADGTDSRQLMLLDAGDESGEIIPAAPAWSPDGTRIAISSFVSVDGSAIFVMNADGSDRRQITGADGLIYDLAWRPRQ